MKSRILFFLPEGNVFTNGVYASQCLELGRYLVKTHGAECLFLQFAIGERGEISLEPGITIINDTKPRRYVPIFLQHLFYKRIAKRFFGRIKDFKPTHIYTRQYQTALGARSLADTLGARLIYSIRGEDVSERQSRGGIKNYFVSRWVKWMVRRAIHVSDHVNTVSNAFAAWLKATYGCEASVVPCCVAEKFFVDDDALCVNDGRKHLRSSLGFSKEDHILIYSGSLFGWQCIDEIIAFMKMICDKSNKQCPIKALFIVKDEKTLAKKCAAFGFDKTYWRVHGCRPNEVGAYLRCGDVGVIVRKDLILNRVASPVKIAEYLASGLAVIASPCIGDFVAEANGSNICHVYSADEAPEKVVSYIAGLTAETCNDARKFARAKYTWVGNDMEIMEMFK